jgi:UPF0716 protein FxsA|tara:strand:- start:575 stop:1033 length:459 start_codon:yes stop_codon:yes gene_type:complete
LWYLILFFVVAPIAEISLLIQVGGEIGSLPTIGLVLLTAGIGFSLLRQQSIETFSRARRKINAGDLPAQEMIETIIVALSGALLVIPGFATDLLGFVGLVPRLRVYLSSRLVSKFFVRSYGKNFTQRQPGNDTVHDKRKVIDAEYWREGEDK